VQYRRGGEADLLGIGLPAPERLAVPDGTVSRSRETNRFVVGAAPTPAPEAGAVSPPAVSPPPTALAFRTRKTLATPPTLPPATPNGISSADSKTKTASARRPLSHDNLTAPNSRRLSGWAALGRDMAGGKYARPSTSNTNTGGASSDDDDAAPLASRGRGALPLRAIATVLPRERLFSMERVRKLFNKAGVDLSPRAATLRGSAAFRTPAADGRHRRATSSR